MNSSHVPGKPSDSSQARFYKKIWIPLKDIFFTVKQDNHTKKLHDDLSAFSDLYRVVYEDVYSHIKAK